MSNLPEHVHHAGCDHYRPEHVQQQPQIVHIHQAPPDKTVQRLALGSGMGAGAVAAGVYFGPLLVAALSTVAITLAVTALAVAVCCWAVVIVVRAVSGGAKTNR
jgi:hypothetical protein